MTKSKMKNKNEGKRFEEDIAASVPKNWFCYRLKDSSGSWSNDKEVSRFTPKNMCDFFIYTGSSLYGIECKSFKGKSMNYSLLSDKKERKLKQLCDMFKTKHASGYFILNFRDLNETYLLSARHLKRLKDLEERKSLSLQDAKDLGHLIPQQLKRVRWKYDLEAVL